MRFIDAMHFINQPAVHQPLYTFFKLGTAGSFFYLSEKELFVLFGKLHGNGFPYHLRSGKLASHYMLTKITAILYQQIILNLTNCFVIFVFRKVLNDFWHTANI